MSELSNGPCVVFVNAGAVRNEPGNDSDEPANTGKKDCPAEEQQDLEDIDNLCSLVNSNTLRASSWHPLRRGKNSRRTDNEVIFDNRVALDNKVTLANNGPTINHHRGALNHHRGVLDHRVMDHRVVGVDTLTLCPPKREHYTGSLRRSSSVNLPLLNTGRVPDILKDDYVGFIRESGPDQEMTSTSQTR